MSALVALVSDFGLSDSYVAEMHLAARARVPGVRVVDVSHQVPAFDRLAAALVIERALARLPRGAALAAVVDPGVGTARRRVFALRDGRWVVGPDNGVLPCAGAEGVWRAREDFLRPSRGVTTFDGREVFAPLAALLAAGLHPALAGEPVTDAVPWVLPRDAEFEIRGGARYARGVVIALDRYGNAVSNVRPPVGGADGEVLAPARFRGPVRAAYGEVGRGEPVALVGSSGRLELSVREGASGLSPGEPVEARWRA